MKTILIIYDPSIKANIDILKDRIKRLGDNYEFWENNWLVKTNLSPEEVYHKIIDKGFEGKSIFISRFNNLPNIGYWGMMKQSIWDWLRK